MLVASRCSSGCMVTWSEERWPLASTISINHSSLNSISRPILRLSPRQTSKVASKQQALFYSIQVKCLLGSESEYEHQAPHLHLFNQARHFRSRHHQMLLNLTTSRGRGNVQIQQAQQTGIYKRLAKGARWLCITPLSYKKRTRGSEPRTLDKSNDVKTVEHSSKQEVP